MEVFMSIKAFVGVVIVVASFQAFAANEAVSFSGSVQRDSEPATTFELAVPAGESSKLTLDDGTILEFSAAASSGDAAQSVIRLLDPSGKQLHSATKPGNAPTSKSFRYLICGGSVTFSSPASEAKVASCPQA
jgi:hypothetical protein